MEERTLKKTPRAGPSSAGESRLPATGSCRAYTGPAQTALSEEEGVVTTRRKEKEGVTSWAGPGLANNTPRPELLTDEDVDFSQPQEYGTERLLRLMRRKKMRGDDDIPEAIKHRDVRGMTPMPPPPQGARKPGPRVVFTHSPAIPAPSTGRRHPGYDSEDWHSDSDMSGISVDSEGLPAPSARTASKRRLEDDKAPSLSKGAVPKAKRGRGRLPITEEMSRLEAQNDRLKRQVAELRRELEELRRRPPELASGDVRQLLSEVSRTNIETFGNMLNARLENLEDRLLPEPRLRPPLAADAKTDTTPAVAACCDVGPVPALVESCPARAATSAAPKKKAPKPKKAKAPPPDETGAATETPAVPPRDPKKGKKKRKRPSMAAQEAARGAANTSPPTAEALWTTVGPRKAKKKNGSATQAAPQKKKAAMLRAPRTAAVALTLQAGAAERGLTYAKILVEAKARIDLEDPSSPRINFRVAQTGARLLTISGEGAQEKADALAAKLRSALSDADVRVSRPVACAEIRVAGLDDSATAADIIQAAARDGGCPAGDIRSGLVTVGPRGDGAIWLRLPIAAAKKLAGSGRLRVGWITARVALLAPRPKRCFRCQENGHVAANCKCADDRSGMCFRCGAQGHKAAECRAAEPNCFLCEAAGREERGHVLGSSACAAPSKPAPATRKRKAPAKSGPRRPKPNSGGARAARRTAPAPASEAMET